MGIPGEESIQMDREFPIPLGISTYCTHKNNLTYILGVGTSNGSQIIYCCRNLPGVGLLIAGNFVNVHLSAKATLKTVVKRILLHCSLSKFLNTFESAVSSVSACMHQNVSFIAPSCGLSLLNPTVVCFVHSTG